MRRDHPLALMLVALLAASLPAHSSQSSKLAVCRTEFAAYPDSQESAKCFYDKIFGADLTLQSEAETAINRLHASHPELPWMTLYLGLSPHSDPSRATVLLRSASHQFAARNDGLGEFLA